MTLITLDLQSRNGKSLAKLEMDSEVRLYVCWQCANSGRTLGHFRAAWVA
jgi:hypothetical protein